MGEVYRARDPRMGREVASKVSAERFSDRFEREVRAVAALSHPNICHIYDVGANYLVMELVEGPTLTSLRTRNWWPYPLVPVLLSVHLPVVSDSRPRNANLYGTYYVPSRNDV